MDSLADHVHAPVMRDFRQRPYFFDSGIRFECTRCGRCCTGAPGEVRVTHAEIGALSDCLGIPVDQFIPLYCRPAAGGLGLKERPDGSCVFYDGGCRVYSARPSQCRTYPFWLKNLRSEEAWDQTCRACPGIGRGRLFQRSEIIALLRDA
jgi:hypothetical protein